MDRRDRERAGRPTAPRTTPGYPSGYPGTRSGARIAASVFRIDARPGRLAATRTSIAVPRPTSIAFAPR